MSIEKLPASLYHFTTFDNFMSIIRSMKIRFSSIDRVNDPSEKMIITRKMLNRADVERYLMKNCKMVSFTKDTHNHQRMWAQYASEGVCIKIDSRKFIEENEGTIEKYNIIANEVEYKIQKGREEREKIKDDKIHGYISESEMQDFAICHAKEILFTKDKDWENEQEYRFIILTNENINFSIYKSFESVCINEKTPIENLLQLQDFMLQSGRIITPDEIQVYSCRLGGAAPMLFHTISAMN